MRKNQKFTQLYFNEADSLMEITTHNTSLKRRLAAYAEKYPELCCMTEDDGEGSMSFLINKRRCCLRLTEPYSEERKQAASALAKEKGIHTRSRRGGAHE